MNTPISSLREPAYLERLLHILQTLHADVLAFQEHWIAAVHDLEGEHYESALNLLHYLALRRCDIRQVQEELAALGLSSLGRSEAHVMATITAVIHLLQLLLHTAADVPAQNILAVGFPKARALREAHTTALLGAPPAHRRVRIMVTMPSDATDNYALVRDLLASGMDCMRINCAHDDAHAWANMIAHLRRAEGEVGRHARVLMDLAGPKLRTGVMEPGPQVIKWRPQRDVYGRMTAPARLWLTPAEMPERPPEAAAACLPMPADWLATAGVGDVIRFTDTRGASRRLTVRRVEGVSRWAEATQTCYVETGTILRLQPAGKRGRKHQREAAIGPLPPVTQSLRLKVGETVRLTGDGEPGAPATVDAQGQRQAPARISCTLPEIFADVQVGERIWFDDGKIGGVIQTVEPDRMTVQITHARPRGEKLYANKGINLPDSTLQLPALTPKDSEDLAFIAAHADLVGYSFVHTAGDVFALQARLAELGATHLGIVLKIETQRAFDQLPELLFAVMRSPVAGVMIARGDLAVECGYERLAEVQEEILWICEAAHMPVIWATQVLENLTRAGVPSRAEITDAAMGERAECVMLNKGPHVVEAVRMLEGILRRMQAHQYKKTPMLRPLSLAQRFPHSYA